MDDSSQWVILVFLVCLVIYFIPFIIALANNSNRMPGIFWLNFLAGWSIVGWIIALVWAVTSNRDNRKKIVGSVSAPLSVADELRKLDKLKKEGLITTEEFEAHKKNLLLT